MIPHRFGAGSAFTVGLEEELMVLDGRTLALAPRGRTLIEGAAGHGLAGEVKEELFASHVELVSEVCAGPGEALEQLAALRLAVRDLAAAAGLAVAAAGTHPFSVPEEQEIAADPRYEEFVRSAGPSARRQGVQGLHVHVGMPDPDTCYRALEGVLPWLPLVLALSANSPYLAGRETGLASNRAELLAQLPRSGAPPAFGSYPAWEAFVERLVALGIVDDYRRAWWDVRPAPRFGTLEVRVPDQPTALALTGALAALVQALCVTVLRGPEPCPDAAGRGLYQQNRWAALRHGTAAELVHPGGDRVVPAPELAAELLELVGPAARELGTETLLAPLDPGSHEGSCQLELGRASGVEAVCADLVARTVGFER